jgi:hypothetical protein
MKICGKFRHYAKPQRVVQSSPSGRPSHNSGFAKFQKIIPLRFIFFRNFVKLQRVSGNFK